MNIEHTHTDMPTEELVKEWIDLVRRKLPNARFQITVCENEPVMWSFLKSLSFIDTAGDTIRTTSDKIEMPFVIKTSSGKCTLCLGGDFTQSQYNEIDRKSSLPPQRSVNMEKIVLKTPYAQIPTAKYWLAGITGMRHVLDVLDADGTVLEEQTITKDYCFKLMALPKGQGTVLAVFGCGTERTLERS